MRFSTACFLLTSCLAGRVSLAQSTAAAPLSDSLRQVAAPALPQAAVPARPLLLRPGFLRVAVPVGFIGIGYWGCQRNNPMYDLRAEMQEETREMFPKGLKTQADDYLRHVPVAAAYGLHLAGVRPERGVVPFTLCYGLAHALSTGAVNYLKKGTEVQRPDDKTDFSSFPSAHTAEAFMTATLLHEQFGKRSPWISVGGYAVASATGAMRIIRNRHWVTDVVAGASVGFLSAELVWRAYPAVARLVPGKLGQKLVIVPTYLPGGAVGVALAVK